MMHKNHGAKGIPRAKTRSARSAAPKWGAMGKVIFWLVWVLEVLGFIFIGGCFVLLLGFDSGSMNQDKLLALTIVLTACAVALFGLIKAVVGMRRGEPGGHLALFLLVPPVAAFLAFGGCVLMSNF